MRVRIQITRARDELDIEEESRGLEWEEYDLATVKTLLDRATKKVLAAYQTEENG